MGEGGFVGATRVPFLVVASRRRVHCSSLIVRRSSSSSLVSDCIYLRVSLLACNLPNLLAELQHDSNAACFALHSLHRHTRLPVLVCVVRPRHPLSSGRVQRPRNQCSKVIHHAQSTRPPTIHRTVVIRKPPSSHHPDLAMAVQ